MSMIRNEAFPTNLSAVVLALLLGILGAVPAALAGGPVYWDWPAGRSFEEVDLQGAAVNELGELVAGWAADRVGPEGSEVYWSLADDGAGGFFTGAGHDGSIYHTDAGGQTRLFAQVGASEVLCLLSVPGRGLYAGTAPEGRLFHLDSHGQIKLLGSVEGGYIWSLAPADGGGVWAAAGTPAAVYRYDPQEGLERAWKLPATHVLDMAPQPDGGVLAATQGPGLVYRLDPDRPERRELLLETPQEEVRRLAAGPGGGWYALALQPKENGDPTAMAVNSSGAVPPTDLMGLHGNGGARPVPASALWRVTGDGGADLLWTGDMDLVQVVWSEATGWLAGGPVGPAEGRSRLLKLVPPSAALAVAGWTGGDVLDLLLQGEWKKDGRLLAAQGHPNSVVAVGPGAGQDRFALSSPLDAGRACRWGRLRWEGAGDLDGVRFSVRSGNRSKPDDSWSEWSDGWNDADRELDVPAARYLQWRVEFPARDAADPARVRSVSVSARRDNTAPRIASLRQEQLQGIQGGGLMNHTENLTQVFRSGLRAEFDRQRAESDPVSRRGAEASRSIEIFTWLAEDRDGDRLEYRLEYRPAGDRLWRRIGEPTRESLMSWDTRDVPDGIYDLRLVASDAPDNPAGTELTSEKLLTGVHVDNTPPRIQGWKLEKTERGFRVRFEAEDAAGVLGGAQLTLPDGTTERLDPRDGICDSRSERFDREVAWPPAGVTDPAPWSVRVEVGDLSGNLAVEEGEIR